MGIVCGAGCNRRLPRAILVEDAQERADDQAEESTYSVGQPLGPGWLIHRGDSLAGVGQLD